MDLIPIGHMESPFETKFGVPRQPGLLPSSRSRLAFDDPESQSDLLDNLKPGDDVILLWFFSHNAEREKSWSKTIRPPLLGGTKRVGVFASRSSFRPNALAISRVRITSVDPKSIELLGADLVNGTPVFDVIPYDASSFSLSNASEGWRASTPWPVLEAVIIPHCALEKILPEMREDIYQLLRQDPRPAYTREGQDGRVFWVQYGNYIIWFEVHEQVLVVTRIYRLDDNERDIIRRSGNLSDPLGSSTHRKSQI